MQVTFQPVQSDFFKRLRAEVNDYFKKNNINQAGGGRLWLKSAVIVTALVGIYITLMVVHPASWWACMGLYAALGTVVTLMGFNMMHDGGHGAFSKKQTVNRVMAYSLNLIGGNAFYWNKKHNISHHSYTNIETADDDIDFDPFLRLHSSQEKRWFHRYQHIYVVLLYGFSFLLWIYFTDFKRYFTRKATSQIVISSMGAKQHSIFWISKVMHVVVFFLLPALVLGFAKAAVGYVVACFVTGFIMSMVFQLAHIVEGLSFAAPSEGIIDVKTEWAVHQVASTANFAMKNKTLTWLLGGLNYQMIHHLFPKVSHVHYPAIRPIILNICKEYHVHFKEYPRLSSALASHFRHLRKAGTAA